MPPRPCRGGARGGVSDEKKQIKGDGKDTVPTPSPPLQGRGVVSKRDCVLNEAVHDASPSLKSPSPLGEGIGVRLWG